MHHRGSQTNITKVFPKPPPCTRVLCPHHTQGASADTLCPALKSPILFADCLNNLKWACLVTSSLVPSAWETGAPWKLLVNRSPIEAIDSELRSLICKTEAIPIWTTADCPTAQMRREMKGPWNQQAVLPAIVLIIPHKKGHQLSASLWERRQSWSWQGVCAGAGICVCTRPRDAARRTGCPGQQGPAKSAHGREQRGEREREKAPESPRPSIRLSVYCSQ